MYGGIPQAVRRQGCCSREGLYETGAPCRASGSESDAANRTLARCHRSGTNRNSNEATASLQKMKKERPRYRDLLPVPLGRRTSLSACPLAHVICCTPGAHITLARMPREMLPEESAVTVSPQRSSLGKTAAATPVDRPVAYNIDTDPRPNRPSWAEEKRVPGIGSGTQVATCPCHV
ncbi:hypothetical protein EJ03DRAFT_87114 [Teratosphaeria nubilosa]|uniref:Uncharacterized protein n=1 Tax=Teratosphaeria nubilosa TaxID=161662 RepID=A0A6G1L9T9_9PEZI|nr:hypothetical protein EJ03DRAFT_87114 [Teratosphaeria nubilosa]